MGGCAGRRVLSGFQESPANSHTCIRRRRGCGWGRVLMRRSPNPRPGITLDLQRRRRPKDAASEKRTRSEAHTSPVPKISAAPALAAVSGTKRIASSAIPFSSIPEYRLPLSNSSVAPVGNNHGFRFDPDGSAKAKKQ